MAAPVIAVERFRVEHGDGFTMPVVSLTDRRAAGNRLVRFVFQRHLETVLYGRSEGSSGPIWKVMNAAGIGSTTMAVNKAAVTAGTITDAEYAALMDAFKSALPADVVDPSSLGRIRNCTIIPLAAAATVVRTFGRSPASMAWLRALSQPIPQAWELREEHEASGRVAQLVWQLDEAARHGGRHDKVEVRQARRGPEGREAVVDIECAVAVTPKVDGAPQRNVGAREVDARVVAAARSPSLEDQLEHVRHRAPS